MNTKYTDALGNMAFKILLSIIAYIGSRKPYVKLITHAVTIVIVIIPWLYGIWKLCTWFCCALFVRGLLSVGSAIASALHRWHWSNRTSVLVHYNDLIMRAMASQITSLMTVYSSVYYRRRSKQNESSASLAFVRGIHRWPVNSPHKGPATRKMFPFDDVIMASEVTPSDVC